MCSFHLAGYTQKQQHPARKKWKFLIRIDLMLKKVDIDLASIVAEEMIRRSSGRRRWIWFIHVNIQPLWEIKILFPYIKRKPTLYSRDANLFQESQQHVGWDGSFMSFIHHNYTNRTEKRGSIWEQRELACFTNISSYRFVLSKTILTLTIYI